MLGRRRNLRLYEALYTVTKLARAVQNSRPRASTCLLFGYSQILGFVVLGFTVGENDSF